MPIAKPTQKSRVQLSCRTVLDLVYDTLGNINFLDILLKTKIHCTRVDNYYIWLYYEKKSLFPHFFRPDKWGNAVVFGLCLDWQTGLGLGWGRLDCFLLGLQNHENGYSCTCGVAVCDILLIYIIVHQADL